MRVINPGIWTTRLTVKVHNLYRVLKNVITVVLIITSGLKNSQNKWLLIMLLFRMNYDDIMMMFYDSVGSDI
jgi:hypothetical protein